MRLDENLAAAHSGQISSIICIAGWTLAIELPVSIKKAIVDHLESLNTEFKTYFNDVPVPPHWSKNPFDEEIIDPMKDEAEELADLKASITMKQAFANKEDISSFRLSVRVFGHTQHSAGERRPFSRRFLQSTGLSDFVTIKSNARVRK